MYNESLGLEQHMHLCRGCGGRQPPALRRVQGAQRPGGGQGGEAPLSGSGAFGPGSWKNIIIFRCIRIQKGAKVAACLVDYEYVVSFDLSENLFFMVVVKITCDKIKGKK